MKTLNQIFFSESRMLRMTPIARILNLCHHLISQIRDLYQYTLLQNNFLRKVTAFQIINTTTQTTHIYFIFVS